MLNASHLQLYYLQKTGVLAEKQGVGEIKMLLCFAFLRHFKFFAFARCCRRGITADQFSGKKSYQKAYGRFFGFCGFW
jgi:hypothetical protein